MTPILFTSFLLLTFSYNCRAQKVPENSHCKTSSECAPDHCCVIGGIRYSVPQCLPLLGEGDTCRPGSNITISGELTYPDGSTLTVKEAHYILCPCGDKLVCDTEKGVCKATGEKRDTNRSLRENNKEKN